MDLIELLGLVGLETQGQTTDHALGRTDNEQLVVDRVAAGVDPVAFRLKHLGDPRMRKVLQAAADAFGYAPAAGPSGRGNPRSAMSAHRRAANSVLAAAGGGGRAFCAK